MPNCYQTKQPKDEKERHCSYGIYGILLLIAVYISYVGIEYRVKPKSLGWHLFRRTVREEWGWLFVPAAFLLLRYHHRILAFLERKYFEAQTTMTGLFGLLLTTISAEAAMHLGGVDHSHAWLAWLIGPVTAVTVAVKQWWKRLKKRP